VWGDGDVLQQDVVRGRPEDEQPDQDVVAFGDPRVVAGDDPV
jgi:hypothetical protein